MLSTVVNVSRENLIDAVIVAYNGRDALRACVEPLARMADVNVVVVDNASPEDPIPAVADLDVTIVRAPRNGGFSYGCNLGVAEGSAPHVLFLNPDASIDAASLTALRAALADDPGAAVVAPRLLGHDGELLYSQRRFPRPLSTLGQALFAHRRFPLASWSDELVRDRAAYEVPGSPDWVSGACMLLRRDALEAIGGMDEGFFLYCEDTDVCRRLRNAGWGVRYVPSAAVRHGEGGSAPRSSLLEVHAQSRLRYARKHLSRRAARLDTAAVALNAATHALASVHRLPVARGHARALRSVVLPGQRTAEL